MAGTEVTVKRVPELMSTEVARKIGAKLDQAAPVAAPAELADYDAIIFGTPTRFGNMAAQMRNFLDQTGGLWVKGALVGKVGSVFTSTGTGGGKETPSSASHHAAPSRHGLCRPAVFLPGAGRHQRGERRHPYGAASIAGADGSRQPSAKELAMAKFQGKHVAAL